MKGVLILLPFALLCVLVAATAPQIPCTFSTEYRETFIYRGTKQPTKSQQSFLRRFSNSAAAVAAQSDDQQHVGDYDERLLWYHVENKMANQDGISDSITFIWKSPAEFTLVSPFFDRRVCIKMTRHDVAPPHCPQFPSDAKLFETNVECPTNKALKCDRWMWTSISYDTDEDGWFVKGTNIPSRVVIETEEYELTEDFIGFNISVPDASHFEPAPTQLCTDVRTVEGVDNNQELVPSSWKPANRVPRMFRGMSIEDFQKTLIPIIPAHSRKANRMQPQQYELARSVVFIPESFDSRSHWPTCNTIGNIRDQAKCGSCWAFGASEAFSDRFCVATNISLLFSPQYLVACSKKNSGCNGGYLDEAWWFLRDTGVVTDACLPYLAVTGTCPYGRCNSTADFKLFKAKNAYSTFVNMDLQANVRAIQEEIITHGPVEAAFYVLEDFYNYGSGVYQHTTGSAFLGGHAIKILGWGVDAESKLPYWLCANSWGTDFGEHGFFRILRGANECGIEAEIASGLPNA